MGYIADNISRIKQNIKSACESSNRNVSDVQLICVTKTKPLEMLQEAYEYGERHFGENKVQEIVAKSPEMPSDTVFHMIGHLQKNKVKKAVELAYMIHSVDSYELAECIDKEAKKINKIQNILIEVNVAMEDSKFGIAFDNAIDFALKLNALENIKVCGFMCVAPYTDDAETNRTYFSRLRKLNEDINSMNIDGLKPHELSMGMSGDYIVAIQEGATFVRVGTDIFGARNYNI